MKKLLTALVATLALVGLTAAAPATADDRPPAVWIVPHQDDETLSMSPDIRVHLNADRNVHVYLMTDGSTTRVCAKMIVMSAADCTRARDAEFVNASRMLGIPEENVHFVADPATGVRPDDRPSQAAAHRMVQWVIDDVDSRYPGQGKAAAYKTMSWSDVHEGHGVFGQALREAYQAGTVDDVRFYLKRDNANVWPSRPSGTTKTVTTTVSYKGRSWYRVQAALKSYGIGNLSVPAMFANMAADPRSIAHDAVR